MNDVENSMISSVAFVDANNHFWPNVNLVSGDGTAPPTPSDPGFVEWRDEMIDAFYTGGIIGGE